MLQATACKHDCSPKLHVLLLNNQVNALCLEDGHWLMQDQCEIIVAS